MKQPLIGVTPLWNRKTNSYSMRAGYMDGILEAGGIPVMLPLTADEEVLAPLCEKLDGFLFTGGPDIEPALYGEEPLPETGAPSPARDAMETRLLSMALDAGKPVFGICRGLQLLNVRLGGTLYQDLASQYGSPVQHRVTEEDPAPMHEITPLPGTPLAALLGDGPIRVNTRHHQAVRELAPPLRAMALSEDGLVEAFYLPERPFVWAVQWHPELTLHSDAESGKLFRRFVEQCR